MMRQAAFFDRSFDSDTVPTLVGAVPSVVAVVGGPGPAEDAADTLASLRRVRYADLETFLISDDGEGDEPSPMQQRFAEITLVRIGSEQRGVPALNLGLRHALAARCDYILLLPTAAELDPLMLAELVDAVEASASVGCAGPVAFDPSDRERRVPAASAPRFRCIANGGVRPTREGDGEPPVDRDWLDGCGLLIRRSVLEQVGLFDPAFSPASAGLDWCLRTRRKGFRCRQVPRARLWRHRVAAGNGHQPSEEAYRRGRDDALLARRHARGLDWARFWLDLAGAVPGTYMAGLVGGDGALARATWRGVVDGLVAPVAPPPRISDLAGSGG